VAPANRKEVEMFCPSCGHDNPPNAQFCGSCGATLTKATPAPAPTPVGGNTAAPGAVSGGLKWGITAASIFIPLIGIIMGVIYLRDANPEKKAVGKLWLWVGIGMAILFFIANLEAG
jgi:uncharacterized membrane protein YvbJ